MAGFHTKTFIRHDDYMTPKYAWDNISHSKEIMNRLHELDKPFILIFPTAKINTNYFRKWKDKGLQIIIPRKRINFIKLVEGEPEENWTNNCNFDCFYYCYKIGLPKDIIWLD